MRADEARARITPYEVGIPGRDFASSRFARIREEATARQVDLTDPGAFVQLGEVGRAIREIQGEERGGDSVQYYGAFLFQAFHFNASGEVFLVLGEEVARHLVDSSKTESWKGELPGPAGYLQLPRNLFWSDAGAADAPEPLDGIFWTRAAKDTLSLLVALGMRTGRPGLSLVEMPPCQLDGVGAWPAQLAREGGADFETTLPGGDLGRLYSVKTVGEVQKLVGRAFAYLATSSDAMGPEERAPRVEREEAPGGPATGSALTFRRILMRGPEPEGEG